MDVQILGETGSGFESFYARGTEEVSKKKTVPDAENYPGRPYDDKDLAADLEKGFQLSGTLSCYFDGFVSYAHRVWLTTLKLLYASCWIYRAVCLIWRGRRVMTSHNLSKL